MPKLTFQPFNPSTFQLFNSPHASLFTFPSASSLLPQPYGIQSHSARSSPVRTSIQKVERGFILRNKPFNHSPVQLFNSLHPSLCYELNFGSFVRCFNFFHKNFPVYIFLNISEVLIPPKAKLLDITILLSISMPSFLI